MLKRTAHSMECESMLFVKNHIPYLRDLSNSFSNSFIDFYRFSSSDISGRMKHKASRRLWRLTQSLNLLHVSRCEKLHFVTSYMKQNKSRKQTLENAQYGLAISFKRNFFNLTGPFTIFQFPIMHYVCPPKFCIYNCCEMLLGDVHIPKSISQQ